MARRRRSYAPRRRASRRSTGFLTKANIKKVLTGVGISAAIGGPMGLGAAYVLGGPMGAAGAYFRPQIMGYLSPMLGGIGGNGGPSTEMLG